MWWKPRTDDDEILLGELDGLRDVYRSQFLDVPAGAPTLVFGIGSAISRGDRRPLLLVNSDVVGVGEEAFISAAETFEYSNLESALGSFPQYSWGDAPELLRRELELWPIPESALIVLAGEPTPLASLAGTVGISAGSEIRSGSIPHLRATAGPRLHAYNSRSAFLTVGHFTQGVGDRVELVHRAWPRLLTGYQQVGHVVAHSDPIFHAPKAKYDFAVVELDSSNVRYVGGVHSGVADRTQPPWTAENVRVHGARSGRVIGMVNGALTDTGGRARQWKNCWMLAPSGLAGDGDSGAAIVTDRSHKLLGQLVGGAAWPGRSAFSQLFVQDARSLVRDELSSLGYVL